MRNDKPITIPAMLNPSPDLALDFALSMSPSNKKTSMFSSIRLKQSKYSHMIALVIAIVYTESKNEERPEDISWKAEQRGWDSIPLYRTLFYELYCTLHEFCTTGMTFIANDDCF